MTLPIFWTLVPSVRDAQSYSDVTSMVLREFASHPPWFHEEAPLLLQSLAGVLAVHTADFVHKSFRPDNILVFGDSKSQGMKAQIFVFERTHPAAAAAGTSLMADMICEGNLYQHSSRKSLEPEHVYIMQCLSSKFSPNSIQF